MAELGDVALGGALVAASLAPAVLAAPIVGVALDRSKHPRRIVALSAAVTMLGFAAVALLGILPVPVIIVLVVAAGCVAPVYYGGLSSFVTDTIPNERRAYALDALSYNISSVAGPALVALAGLSGDARLGVWLMAGAAAVGAVATTALHVNPRTFVPESVLATILAGLRHLVGHRPLGLVIVAGGVSQFASGALPIVAVALSIERAGTPDDAALIVTAFAIGGLVGALIFALRPSERLTPQLVMGAGFALTGIFTLVAVPDLGLIWVVLAVGVSGLFTAPSGAAMLLLRKQQSPPAVRSQVFTIGSGLRATTGALGAGVAGALAGLDAGVLIAGVGVIWIASALMMLAYPNGLAPLDEPEVLSRG